MSEIQRYLSKTAAKNIWYSRRSDKVWAHPMWRLWMNGIQSTAKIPVSHRPPPASIGLLFWLEPNIINPTSANGDRVRVCSSWGDQSSNAGIKLCTDAISTSKQGVRLIQSVPFYGAHAGLAICSKLFRLRTASCPPFPEAALRQTVINAKPRAQIDNDHQ